MNRAILAQRLSGLAGPRAVGSPPEESVAFVAEMIEQLDPRSACYEANVDMLLSLEATIWARECGGAMQSGPPGRSSPTGRMGGRDA